MSGIEPERTATVHVTRWALAGGVETWNDAAISRWRDQETATERCENWWQQRSARLGSDAFESREEALRDAIKRADKKLVSIEKQAAKVRKFRGEWAKELGS